MSAVRRMITDAMRGSRILMNLALATLLFGSAFAYSDTDADDCSSYSKNPDLRIEACNRILSDTSISTNVRALVHIKRGEAYIMKKDNERALSEYEQGIKLNPKNWEGYNGRGVLLSKMGQYDRAFADYNKATQLNPTHPWPWINRCEDNLKLGRTAEAANQCNKLVALNKGAMSYHLRGVLNLKLGKLDLAIADFDEAIRQSPNYALAFYGRGLAKKQKGDLSGGATDSAAAAAIQPDAAKAFSERYR